ncbi:hypothetical protein [Pantoea sp. 3_1284]|uniref:hypothetical protein n=1 Tax=Pantoea sp. 3_1284 TaxID=2259618 RepID=UPI000DE50123|nr:hypothetical protein [Pantoea sp. 3_1284]RBO13351.1 hypothetical protein DSL62_09040 [Pantoea sp. 3_1284]
MSCEWNGDGFPPVGCECELFDCENWNPVIIKFVGEKYVVTERTDLGCEVVYCLAKRPDRFRPICTESNRIRSEICDKIYGAMCKAERKDNRSDMAEAVYDAIATGKIPQITLK